ncbi:MAG: gamma-glutamyl-gamma-aminobutyrate hydrolase family protein [Ruminococcus sp.]|nr:gamma-glutamyl-gamma-aminobutyrate hydrolase family protein [Ruminococcus sp.]MEE3440107.1 gamma-glutamyl-gamma-aminobutyrate hydrolase family protein [Ruminococcus sp.]
MVNMCDGFLFTGGQDISPSLYSEDKSSLCGEVCEERDTMEKILFAKVLENDKSALGICRGIQFFNAYLGGTIYQDLIAETKTKVFHKQKPPYGKPSHIVNLVKGSPLQNLLKTDNLPVNSYHHQGVKKLADNLKPMAYATDNLVESVYMPGKKFVWAVQWHPEFSYTTDKYSRMIFRAFVDSCL